MKIKSIIIIICASIITTAQTLVTTIPQYPTEIDSIIITFDVKNATHQNKIANYTGDVYAHTGVTVKDQNGHVTKWQYVIGDWGRNDIQPKLTRLTTDVYQIVINNPRKFYNVDQSFKITELCFVLRSSDGSKQTEDIFVPIYEPGISILILKPFLNRLFNDPLNSPIFIEEKESIDISAKSVAIGTKTKEMKLLINRKEVLLNNYDSLSFSFNAQDYPSGANYITIITKDTSGLIDSVSFVIMKNPLQKNIELPSGLEHGINYINDKEVYLVLFAPYKKFIYLIGDFNDWKVDTNYFMNRYEVRPDSVLYWIKLNNLENGKEYAYQYYIDGNIRIPDPYAEKILDPWNDSSIPSNVYPNLKVYPYGKTENIVSVFKLPKEQYNWNVKNFVKPVKENLIIYELLVRDFVSTHSFQTLIDTISYFKKLGVNAIELMPIMEFEGNSSWGYNPMMYFAVDKYYGPAEKLKEFVDSCHSNGIAVILDIVLNHAYGLNPMVRMYWDTLNARPAANNPWFNQVSPNNVFYWGYDFNHESKNTKYFVDRVTSYWLNEFKADGFRFDFTKGFTNTKGDGSAYDPSRIRILKRIADKIWTIDSTAYVILEHFATDQEEKELSDYGMMLWGNLNYNYAQASMGYSDNSNFGRISYKSRGFTKPNLVGYMESHDEERLMYKNLRWGNSSGSYDIKKLNYALSRIKLVSAFFFTVPGPKMIWQFGELGYDYSIDYNGRLGEKPIRWDYYTDSKFSERQKLFKVFTELISLKKKYKVFRTNNFSLNLSSFVKKIDLYDSTMNVTIIGNFDVVSHSSEFSFSNDSANANWYEYFTGDSIKIENGKINIDLQPGEFRIYTSLKISTPQNGRDIISSIMQNEKEILKDYVVYQNYPNPFNPITVLKWNLPKKGNVLIKLYNILGQEISVLVDEIEEAGEHQFFFNADNYNISSGVYFVTFYLDNFVKTKKLILLK